MEFIRRVGIGEKDYRRPDGGGGGPKKVFGEVTRELRRRLSAALNESAQAAFNRSHGLDVPGVVKVRLKQKAWAKSHRPMSLFSQYTCPIIGVGAFGDLFVSVTEVGLASVLEKIESANSKLAVANISTIEEISPYTIADALKGQDIAESGGGYFVTLFRYLDEQANDDARGYFEELLREHRLEFSSVRHDPDRYLLPNATAVQVQEVADFVAVRSISIRGSVSIIPYVSTAVGDVAPEDFPTPLDGVNYPVAGFVDSGIPADHALLAPWVYGRNEFVPKQYQAHDHGTFVAGLIVNARRLNHSDARFPAGGVKVVDTVALGNNEHVCRPDDLLAILEEQLERYPEVKVWNLSLGLALTVADHQFSDLAVSLDQLQDEYDVLFVIAAGNYGGGQDPFRQWPPQAGLGMDRVTSPADSVRSLVVGSVASRESPSSVVRNEEPSPFSRCGPGPAYIPKPELTWFGGNCNERGGYSQIGVLSINPGGQLAENIGTSFAAPLVTSCAAKVHSSISLQDGWRVATKALLIHSAFLKETKVTAESLPYFGFGTPADADQVMRCASDTGTLFFSGELVPGLEFEKWPLPVPDCLVNEDGRFVGEVVVTLVYEPPLDIQYGAEYCRSNVDVSIGRYVEGDDGKRRHNLEIPAQPADANQLYEYLQLQFGFKWSPVKVYRRVFRKGIPADDWRLKVSMQDRAEFQTENPLKFCLLISFRDPEGERPVNEDLDRKLQEYAWEMEDIVIEDRVRLINNGEV